ncbi:alpha/beta-hydrolase, partial [Sistotremastrum niveocremeum HHB9708]
HSPSPWLVALTFVGLPLSLWIYKCMMMVLFQRKIIYMAYVPPGARDEDLDLNDPILRGVRCEVVQIPTGPKSSIAGIAFESSGSQISSNPPLVIIYFQGNAGNPLGRLPVFRKLCDGLSPLPVSILAVAPRSYWKSTPRRPSQSGITSDYVAALEEALRRWPNSLICVYGHSLGASIAVNVLDSLSIDDFPQVQGLVLENSFTSVPDMVSALYPARWLPYRYLGRFVWDKWDALSAMEKSMPNSILSVVKQNALIFSSEKDELVPTSMSHSLYDGAARGDGSRAKLVSIRGALHETAWQKEQWIQ